MLRLCAFVLIALLASSGCALLSSSAPRDLGQRFADILDARSDAPVESLMAPDATVYLQGGAPTSRQAFKDYVERMQRNGQQFHRMSNVYVTPSGAGWLVGITRPETEPTPSLWLEVAIDEGRITRAWFHFTVETLQSVHQPAATYAANMAAMQLPLPEGWANGTPALLAAAEQYDAAHEPGPELPPVPVDALAALGALAAVAVVLRRVAWPTPGNPEPPLAPTRHAALLAGVRSRREQAGTGTSIPV